MPEFRGQKDLRSYLRVLWRWKWLFLALLIVCPLVAYLLERGKPNVYQSSALVGINSETVNVSGLNNVGGFSTTNITAIAELVKTSPVADVAAGLMHPRADPGQIVGEVTASGDPTTNFLTITAQDGNPVRAAQIANAFARAIGFNQQRAAIEQIRSAIASTQAEISHLHRSSASLRPGLEAQLAQLRGAISTQGGQSAILQAATPNYTPTGPHLRRTVELGLLIGLLLALGAVVLAESADRRMRTPDDLEGITDLPLLGSIAPSAFGESLELSPVDEEAFQTLRTSITYFNVDQALKSVLITSPGEKEGKTTIAVHLATAAARAGSRVILVDADLRRAGVTQKMGLDSSTGLADVLSNQREVDDALVEVPLSEDAVGQLRVLPAGPHPPNPAALMSSNRMQELVGELERDADLVIIDSPAALAVSDSVPLMKSVSGIVLVARLNQSDQATVERLRQIVTSAHGQLLGVVATGVASGVGYGQYTRSYYAPRSRDPKKRTRFRRRPQPQNSNPALFVQPSDQPLSSRQD